MLLACRVETVGGLVEHEQAWPDEQSGGQPEPLTHSEGEATDLVVGDIGQTHLGENVVYPCGPGAGRAEAGQRGEVAPSGQGWVEAGAVDKAGDTVRSRQRPPDRHAQDLEGAAVGDGQAEQKAEQRCLPGAVRSDHPVNLTGGDIKIDTVERDDITEILRDPTGPHRTRHAGQVFRLHRGIVQGTY